MKKGYVKQRRVGYAMAVVGTCVYLVAGALCLGNIDKIGVDKQATYDSLVSFAVAASGASVSAIGPIIVAESRVREKREKYLEEICAE